MNDSGPVPPRVLELAAGGAPVTCTPLPGVNRGAFLVRADGDARTVVRRASDREVTASRAAGAADVGPPVVGAVDGWMVTEWLPGERLSALELGRPAVVDGVAELLHRWHLCGVELPPASMQTARADYVESAGLPALPWLGAVDLAEQSLPASPRVPAHLDVAANLLMTEVGPRLIDFEYAASATPAQELGQLVWEAELRPPQVDRLVRAYWGPGVGAAERASVTTWAWVTGVTWALWAAGRPDLAGYSRRSWERLTGHWALPAGLRRGLLADPPQPGR